MVNLILYNYSIELYNFFMKRLFKEMPWFTKEWKNLGFDDDALSGLQNIILDDPKAGNLIQGTGGVRKLRFAFVGKGKSGSCRIIYADYASYEIVYLIAAYKKSDKETLTKNERNEIKKLLQKIKEQEREAKK